MILTKNRGDSRPGRWAQVPEPAHECAGPRGQPLWSPEAPAPQSMRARLAPEPTCRSTCRRPRLSRHFRGDAEVMLPSLGIRPDPRGQPSPPWLPGLPEPGKRAGVNGSSPLAGESGNRGRSGPAGGARPRPLPRGRRHLGKGRALPRILSGTPGTTPAGRLPGQREHPWLGRLLAKSDGLQTLPHFQRPVLSCCDSSTTMTVS